MLHNNSSGLLVCMCRSRRCVNNAKVYSKLGQGNYGIDSVEPHIIRQAFTGSC